jgi:hypothetical protein
MFVIAIKQLDGNMLWHKIRIKNIKKESLYLKKHIFRNYHGLLDEGKEIDNNLK